MPCRKQGNRVRAWRTIASSGSGCRSGVRSRRPRGVTWSARSKTSATRRSTFPITSSTPSSHRSRPSRSPRRTPPRCASGCSCSATTTSIPPIVAKEAADHRPVVRRPARVRARRRLDAERLRRAGVPVRRGRGSGRSTRRGARRRQGFVVRRAVRLQGRALHDHGIRRAAEAGPTAGSADRDRWRCAPGPAPRRAGGRHRRDQPQPASRGGGPGHGPEHEGRADPPEGGVDQGGRGGPLRRPRALDPLLLRRDDRRCPRRRRVDRARRSA